MSAATHSLPTFPPEIPPNPAHPVPPPEVAAHHTGLDAETAVGQAISLFQSMDPKRSGKRVPGILRDLARGEVARAERRMLVLDSGAGIHRFRRRLSSVYLPDDVVLSTAALLARAADKDLDRRGRVELLLRRLLVVTEEHGESVLAREVAEPILAAVSGGTTAPADVRTRTLEAFHDAIAKLHACNSVDEIFSKWILADAMSQKATLGPEFRDPELLYASITFDVEVENRLAFLARLEGVPVGEVSFRHWKMELELRAMFKKMKDGERYRIGAFDKVDWRKFKWRKGLGRLRDPKPAARQFHAKRVFRLAFLASIVLAVGVALLPKPDMLAEGVYPSDISPLISKSITNGVATVLFADASAWKEMGNDARKAEARSIRANLEKAGVHSAMVEAGGAIAIRIEGGQVTFVDTKEPS